MPSLPLIADAANATPIHAIRATDWGVWLESRAEALKVQARASDYRAQAGKTLIVTGPDGAIERILLGLGETGSPMLFGAAAASLPGGDYRIAEAPPGLDLALATTAWAMGGYVFERYKPRKRPPARLAAPDGLDLAQVYRVADAVRLVRDLVNTGPGDMGPEGLHAAAQAVAEEIGARFEAVVGDALLAQNFPMIHAVGRAAKEAPRLLRLSWGGETHPRVTLVGKGVTFDSGGLNIKLEGGMRLMKKDMGGAAHALALGRLVAQSNLPVRLDVWLPVVENAIGADAFRPGDVLRSRKGLSVEIDNTDAEGRLILADALCRACEDAPELLVDFATLTGAARVALGPDLPPLFTDDEALATAFAKASAETHDPLWRLPLWSAYEENLDSPVADIVNSDKTGFAGSITAALFLRKFVTAKSWAHFDVYAWSPKDKPARPMGGDAHALRATWALLEARYRASA